MRHVAIDAEHPPHERERLFVFARIAVESDGESPPMHLSDASDHGVARRAERADGLSIRGKDVDDIIRQTSEHAHREIEPVRSRDRTFMPRARDRRARAYR